MPFVPHTKQDIAEMLAEIGVDSIQTLFDEIPIDLQAKTLPSMPAHLTEMELSQLMQHCAQQDSGLKCFIGAGAYEHHIPAAVWEIASRGEFLTAYTPYQAEASQGTLQLLYEYQTMMASLMGLDVSNASLYEGASALAEAILMAVRLSRRRQTQPRILLPMTVHPNYRQVVKTIAGQQGIVIDEAPFDSKTGTITSSVLEKHAGRDYTAIVVPQPNFFGLLEDVDILTDWGHGQKAFVIGTVNPLAMAWLKPPGHWGNAGADIACGEGQPLGVPMASGGPYYGFLCCKKSLVRQMPGRIVGRTTDIAGKPGFVLTLQAREQHIRRAKATSNICTNQGLLVTASTIYISLLGPHGLRQVAMACYQNRILLIEKLSTLPLVNLRFTGPAFHELVLELPVSSELVLQRLAVHRIQGGLALSQVYPELKDALLICVTETKSPEEIEFFVQTLAQVLTELTSTHPPQNASFNSSRVAPAPSGGPIDFTALPRE